MILSAIFLSFREKYERKIEKLMLFVFSIMHYNGTPAISSFINKKSLGDIEIPEGLGDLASVVEKDEPETLQTDAQSVMNSRTNITILGSSNSP